MKIELIKKNAEGPKKEDIILFVHGAWQGAWCWDAHFMDVFTKNGYDCYSFNLRGHGTGGQVKGINKFTLGNYLEDLIAAVEQLPQAPIIVGHSMGGLLLQKFLEKRSCKKAILLASVPPSGVLRTTLNLIFSKSYAIGSVLTFNLYGLVKTPARAKWIFFSNTTDENTLDTYTPKLSGESFVAFLGMLFPMVKTKHHTEIPMLVLAAAKDNVISVAENTKTAKRYKADLKIIDNMGHAMMLDNGHELVSGSILEWLQK